MEELNLEIKKEIENLNNRLNHDRRITEMNLPEDLTEDKFYLNAKNYLTIIKEVLGLYSTYNSIKMRKNIEFKSFSDIIITSLNKGYVYLPKDFISVILDLGFIFDNMVRSIDKEGYKDILLDRWVSENTPYLTWDYYLYELRRKKESESGIDVGLFDLANSKNKFNFGVMDIEGEFYILLNKITPTHILKLILILLLGVPKTN